MIKNAPPGTIYEGKRVRVVDANTEIHAIYYSVELKNGTVLDGFSGNTASECEEAKRSAIDFAKQVDVDLTEES